MVAVTDAVTDAAVDAEMMAVVGFGSSFFFASAAVAAALAVETASAAKQNIKQGPILSLDRALFSFINYKRLWPFSCSGL